MPNPSLNFKVRKEIIGLYSTYFYEIILQNRTLFPSERFHLIDLHGFAKMRTVVCGKTLVSL